MTKLNDEGAGMVSIGQLAKAAGVSSRTIRYYEELGILPQPRRSPGGTRMYPREYGGYLAAALALKDLGFRLDEVKPLARLAVGRAVSQGQRDIATRLVEARLAALSRQVTALRQLHASVRGPDSDLPLSAVLGRIAADHAESAVVVPLASDTLTRQELASRWGSPVPAAHERGGAR